MTVENEKHFQKIKIKKYEFLIFFYEYVKSWPK